ncbi:DUF2269 domain-containing protein [Sphingomonas sp.]|uniref:DUF2269 family protein n=1 Tax=Sphingomonas sp. TaxID=28214 RepID=UPI0033425266
MAYETAKFIHILGIIMLLGNVTATAIWKFFADRSKDPKIVGFGQRLVTLTDWSLTVWGAALTMIGGYGAAAIAQIDLVSERWLLLGQILFVASGALWIGILVPLQVRLARMARTFESGDAIPDAYWRASRTWFIVGLLITVPLVAAAWVMVAKPS